MRILVVGPYWLGQWTEYCAAALRRLGHEVDMIFNERKMETYILAARVRASSGGVKQNIFKSLDQSWLNLLNRRVVRQAVRFQPDLLLMLKGEYISASTLAEIKQKTDASLAAWWLDDPFRTPNFVPSISLFDHFFSFDRAYLNPILENGAKSASYLPCACDIDVMRPLRLNQAEQHRYGSQVSFVGTYYPEREQMLAALNGVDLAIWGVGWKRSVSKKKDSLNRFYKGRAMPDKAVKIYNASGISINIHHPQTIDGGLNVRTFELAACRTFQLVDYVPGIEELFEVDKEIVCYKDADELNEKVSYYLDHSDERKRIAEMAHKRLRREHTLQHRMETLLNELSI